MGSQEVALFRDMLVRKGCPDHLISVECAWVAQQAIGTAAHIVECVRVVEEFIDGKRREREEG